MKIVREHINEKFEEGDVDPITNMGIGAIKYFEKFLELFPEQDKDYLFYSFTIFEGYIYFWGYSLVIEKKLIDENNKPKYVLDYFKKIIDNLGLNKILYNVELYYMPKSFFNDDDKIDGYLIKCKMHNAAKHIFKEGNYRKSVYKESEKFEFYERVTNEFKKNIVLYNNNIKPIR